jgi:nucleoside-diphosphate-sugar epimerase
MRAPFSGSRYNPANPKPETRNPKLLMPTALITGGAGFIGSHLADRLLAEGWTVRVLDNLATGREGNLRDARDRIRFVRGDILDGAVLREHATGCDTVFHLAALASVPRSIAAPAESDRANGAGTLSVLLAAAAAGVRRCVAASSSSVYGNAGDGAVRENRPLQPLSPYGVSKLATEHFLRLFDATGRLETVALRFFNVYGPRQDPHSPYAAVIPLFIAACREGRPPVIYGDGGQARDFTYVADVTDAVVRAAVRPEARGMALNVAGGRPTSVRRLADLIRARFPGAPAPVHAPPRPGEIRNSCADTARLKAVLGFVPATPVEDGIRHTVAAFQ